MFDFNILILWIFVFLFIKQKFINNNLLIDTTSVFVSSSYQLEMLETENIGREMHLCIWNQFSENDIKFYKCPQITQKNYWDW